MQVIFLGGASGIGASCIALQFGDSWVLVDAGIRMDAHSDRLPDLSVLQGKNLVAIFVTHAHADHIGALPLVHQAFPTVPIYASRATMLLMEVMLKDALQVMEKRATTEFEVPLYDETMVASTLHNLHPIPLTGTISIRELPGVAVHTSRSGHVAGALSIGFDAPDGRVLISGDVSVTPQHTVPGAQLSTLRHPDLFIIESTYGARLHPNRQAEEDRLASTVSEGIERGGHVLIPAFALGRAQEILRILHTAQRKGAIPEFPVWVDGLVRRVCSTYTAIPNALTTRLQRQIHKGYPPFFSGMVRSVTDVKQRDRILQGNPACIVSSSGMLTGGPSAFYAASIAENPDASILITGYQDDEAPGRRLLELAEQSNNGRKLELGDRVVNVRCRFDRYHLSAHADGNELTAMVSAIKPKKVALVHGDPQSRATLAQRMERFAEITMPSDGTVLEIQPAKKRAAEPVERRRVADPPSTGNGQPAGAQERPITPTNPSSIESLWYAVADGSGTQLVSVRELALAWYGADAGQSEETVLRTELDKQSREGQMEELYFVPVPELDGLYRVRAPQGGTEEVLQHYRKLQPGAVVLLQVYGEKLVPAVCFDARAEAVWAYMPSNESNRTRFPRTAVIEVIGKWESYPIVDVAETRQKLTDLVKATNRWQRQNPVRSIVEHMEPGRSYTLAEIAERVGVAQDDLVGMMTLAMMLNDMPRLFVRQQTMMLATIPRETQYMLHEEWQIALEEGIGEVRPDQMWILSVLEKYLGNPSDLYRRSVNPDTGEVTLAFHFPSIARHHYEEALTRASEEAGVAITIAPQPHQGALNEVAQSALPAGLSISKTSLYHDRSVLRLRCGGVASDEELEQAINDFAQRSGWTLEIEVEPQPENLDTQRSKLNAKAVQEASQRLDLHTAMAFVRAELREDTGLYKVSADQANWTLLARFHFPDIAAEKYADKLAELTRKTGWNITVYPEPHQGAMEALVRRIIPESLEIAGAPSLYRKHRQVGVKVRGTKDEEMLKGIKQEFFATTGWTLLVSEG